MNREIRKDVGSQAERAVTAVWLARRQAFVRHAFPDSVLDRIRARCPDVHAEVRHRPDFVTTTAMTYGPVYVDVKASAWVEVRELNAHELLSLVAPVCYVVPRGEDPHHWCVFWHPGSTSRLEFRLAKSEIASGDVGWTPAELLRFDDFWPNGGAR